MKSKNLSLALAICIASIVGISCGEEPAPAAPDRPKQAAKVPAARAKEVETPESVAANRPTERPARILTREDFGPAARDPFQTANVAEEPEAQVEAQQVRQREVVLPNYDLNDLRLIAIVKSAASIRPRALFVGSDGMSKSVEQGEYFSRNEVLLAAVNNDYIEIEIVDEEMAKALNMARGERRAIYIKKD